MPDHGIGGGYFAKGFLGFFRYGGVKGNFFVEHLFFFLLFNSGWIAYLLSAKSEVPHWVLWLMYVMTPWCIA